MARDGVPQRATGRRLAFWGTVAGVSILSQFGLELAARKIHNAGFQRLVGFVHSGGQS